MNVDKIAAVYAQALLEAAVEKGELDRILEEVNAFEGILRENRDIQRFIANPRIERSAKKKSLEAALRGKTSDMFLDFLFLTIDKNRQMYLLDMISEFKDLHDEKAGIVRADAVSAVPMSEEILQELTARLQGQLEKTVIVTNKVEPRILGGLLVRFDGMVADGSLKTALDEIRAGMKTAKFGSEFVHED